MKYKVKVTIESIDHNDLVNLFSMEADGYDYWAELSLEDGVYEKYRERLIKNGMPEENVCREDVYADAIFNDEKLVVTDLEEDKEYKLKLEDILKGFRLNALNRPWEFDIDEGDAIMADEIMQYAVFGEIVYG